MMIVKKHLIIILCIGILFLAACVPASQIPTATAVDEPTEPATVPTPGPGLPPAAVLEAQDWLADQLNIDVQQVEIQAMEQVDWRDGCLELGKPDEGCLQVITPGWKIIFLAEGQTYEVHTNETASIIRLADEDQTSNVPPALLNTQWMLVSFGLPGEESPETPVLDGTNITVEFQEGGAATGSGGCNQYGVTYEIQGNTISFGQVTSTLRACADEEMTLQEQNYFEALQSALKFEEAGDHLTLFYDNGRLNFIRTETAQTSGESIQIHRIQMLDQQIGWAAGKMNNDGASLILQTIDGGENWVDRTPLEAPQTTEGPVQDPPDFFAASAQNAWVVYPGQPGQAEESGIFVWSTQDGGENWIKSEALDLSGIPMDYFIPSHLGFLDTQFGWMLAHLGAGMSHDYFAIFTTEDGGKTWKRVADPDNNGEIQGCVKSGLVFASPSEGWFSGNCPGLMPPLFFYQTTDGGVTWSPIQLPTPEGLALAEGQELGDLCGIPQLTRMNTDTITIRFILNCLDLEQNTAQSWLGTSSEQGITWEYSPLPASNATIQFLSEQEGWLLGAEENDPQASKTLYHTIDGGKTWEILSEGIQGDQVDFVDSQNGWIVFNNMDNNDLLHSKDGGVSWQKLDPLVSL